MFAGMLTLQQLGVDKVSWVFSVFPALGLVGMMFSEESPIFHAR